MPKQLDIVLPAYNPKPGWLERVSEVVAQLQTLYAERGVQFRLVISPDGSWERAYPADVQRAIVALSESLSLPIKVVRYDRNRGRGFAVRSALLLSDATYILYTDYDFPFDIATYTAVVDALLSEEAPADVVVGRRSEEYQRLLSAFRHFLNSGSHFLNRLFLGLPVIDTQGGVKGMNLRGREALLDGKICSFLFDTEFIARATRLGLSIRAVPSCVRPEIQLSSMGWRVLLKEVVHIPRLFYVRWFSKK